MKKIIFLILILSLFISCANKYADLNKKDKQLYEEIVYIASEQELEEFMELSSEERDEWIKNFWKKRDPTPTTEKNERKEEHFRRIKYANEHFSLAVADVPGWKTDIGRIYIKYGPPDKTEKKDIGLKQTWIYYDYGLKYEFDEFGRIIHPFPGDQEYEVYISKQLNAPLDGFKLGGGRFKAYFDHAIFKNDETTSNLEIYYAIPLKELYFSESDTMQFITLEERYAIFDTLGNEIKKKVETRHIKKLETPEFVDGIQKIALNPGDYQIAFSIIDVAVEKSANFRKEFHIPDYSDTLSISDIELAKRITPKTENEEFQKGKYNIIPNPTRTYEKGKLLYLYFEVYNLELNASGQAQLKVEYRINGKNLLLETLVYKRDYQTDNNFIAITEALSLHKTPFDQYSLIVKVLDHNSEEIASTNKKFTVVGWSVY